MTGQEDGTVELILSIYKRDFNRLVRVATAVTGDYEVGREAVQEAFVRALRHHAKFRGVGSLEGWLWRIVIREASTARGKLPGDAADPIDVGVVDARQDGYPSLADVRDRLGQLPERQRLVLFLRYYADLDYRQIAESLGLRAGTVGSTLNAALSAMRHLLEEAS